jgi:hypothetical protein
VEAALELGEPALLPLLVELDAAGWADTDPRGGILQEAIEACTPADPESDAD